MLLGPSIDLTKVQILSIQAGEVLAGTAQRYTQLYPLVNARALLSPKIFSWLVLLTKLKHPKGIRNGF